MPNRKEATVKYRKTILGAALAAASALAIAAAQAAPAQLVTNGPQANPAGAWSAHQNVIESHNYDRLVETNRSFRAARERDECGPVTDPQLHAQCIASFRRYE
jgi:hypothetical protein